MLVSHSHRFIYLKTKKTAGTSIEAALQPHCQPPGSAVGHDTAAMETVWGIVGARSPRPLNPDIRWRNHMSAREMRDNLAPGIWSGYRRICAIRNPWDKTVSAFHFSKAGMLPERPGDIIAAFRAFLANPDRWQWGQSWQDWDIHTLDGLPVIDTYIRYGRIEEDLAELCQQIDIPKPELPRFKTEFRQPHIPYQDYYDAATTEWVAMVYGQAISLFGWHFDRPDPARLPVAGDRLFVRAENE